MDDWRLDGQEEYLKGKTLLKVFPNALCYEAHKSKNGFYVYVKRNAKFHGIIEEHFEDGEWKEIWHEHCEFCWEKIGAHTLEECYYTVDFYRWVCKKCFNDFKNHFEWKVIENAQDIPAK